LKGQTHLPIKLLCRYNTISLSKQSNRCTGGRPATSSVILSDCLWEVTSI